MSNSVTPPNILFIMTDQHRADCAGPACVGLETPALNRIAADGVVFNNCFTNSPQCVSARAALHYGLYPHQSNVTSNGTPIFEDPARDTWVKRISRAGYHMSVFGKTHLTRAGGDLIASEGKLRALGFDLVMEENGPRQSRRTRSHMTENWDRLGLLEKFRNDIETRKDDPACVRPSPLGLEQYYDTWVAQHAFEFLSEYDHDRPFFCWVSFPGPHEPYDTPEPYASMYSPKDMPKAVPRPEKVGGAPGVLHDLLSRQCPENPGLSGDQIARLRANYAGGVRLIDDQIARILELLKQQGRYDDTVILFTSDHGEMNGDWGMLRKKVFLDASARVPLIVKPAIQNRANKAGGRCDALIELMDVGPTLLQLSGADDAAGLGGRSFAAVVDGGAQRHREIVRSQYDCDRMILSAQWKLVLNKDGAPGLLFDRLNDPLEQRNLVGEVDPRSCFESTDYERLSA